MEWGTGSSVGCWGPWAGSEGCLLPGGWQAAASPSTGLSSALGNVLGFLGIGPARGEERGDLCCLGRLCCMLPSPADVRGRMETPSEQTCKSHGVVACYAGRSAVLPGVIQPSGMVPEPGQSGVGALGHDCAAWGPAGVPVRNFTAGFSSRSSPSPGSSRIMVLIPYSAHRLSPWQEVNEQRTGPRACPGYMILSSTHQRIALLCWLGSDHSHGGQPCYGTCYQAFAQHPWC